MKGHWRGAAAAVGLLIWLAGCVSADRQQPSAAFLQSVGPLPPVEQRHKALPPATRQPLLEAGRFSSGFGWRRHPMGGGRGHHDGIDIAAPAGTPVRAASMGLVVEKGWRGSYGRLIRLSHASDLETVYAHLSRFPDDLSVGDRVRQGQVIGYVGSTGRSTGPHLHFEVHEKGVPVDPMRFPQFTRGF